MKSPVYVTALQDLWIWEDVLDVSYKCCAFLQYIILPKKMEEEEKHNKTIASPDQYSHKNNAYFSLPPGHAGVK